MSKNTDLDALAAELSSLGADTGSGKSDLLVARVLRGISQRRWKEFCNAHAMNHWGALPVSSLPVTRLADLGADAGAPSGLVYALMADVFTRQLQRELTRLSRTGGELSLVCARPLADTEDEALLARLEKALADSMHARLDSCDSLTLDEHGHPMALLPGTGPVRVRYMAEQVQQELSAAARKICPGGTCALGIICAGQGEELSPDRLIEQVHAALAEAPRQKDRIRLLLTKSLDDRATMVHSDEKRFLFFGA
ncbi:MAG: hypothetical protein J5838_06400 [Desulfovibrio sp.]|nr:hypothetical protein [Desulfovibrio sp.]